MQNTIPLTPFQAWVESFKKTRCIRQIVQPQLLCQTCKDIILNIREMPALVEGHGTNYVAGGAV